MNKAIKESSGRCQTRTNTKRLKKSFTDFLFVIVIAVLLIVLLVLNLSEVYRIKKDFLEDSKLTLVFNNSRY